MPPITEEHVVDSIADALQFIACYHPPDFVAAMREAHKREESPGARNAIAQILVNSRLCALGHRPICQDTGVANITVEIGVEAPIAWKRPLQAIADEATAIPSAPRWWTSRSARAATRATTRRRWSRSRWLPATGSGSPSPPRAAARRTRRSSPS
jgi:tartrate dehydratase alpha subunit/fumarate hydratase class I-like protein